MKIQTETEFTLSFTNMEALQLLKEIRETFMLTQEARIGSSFISLEKLEHIENLLACELET